MLNASLHLQSLDLWLGLKFSVNVKPPMYDVAMCVCVCMCLSMLSINLWVKLNRFLSLPLLTGSIMFVSVGVVRTCFFLSVRTSV